MPKLITLSCPACGAKNAIAAEDIRYTCTFCGKEQVLHSPAAEPGSEPNSSRQAYSQPAEIITEANGETLRLERRWYKPGTIGLAIFCVFWDGFLFFWYWIALRTGAGKEMFLGPILHVLVGAGITYGVLAGFINRTVISFDRQQLSVRHGPLPWWGNRAVPIREIRQLFTKESNVKKNGASTYNLFYTTADGRAKKLLSGLDSPDTAVFIEQQIEGWLNISDQPVGGEIPR